MALDLNIFLALHFSFYCTQLHSPNLLVRLPFRSHQCFPVCVNLCFSSSFKWTGYFLWVWMTGVVFSLMCIFYFPGKLLTPWNLSGYSFARSSMFYIFLLSFVIILQLICTIPNYIDGLSPYIAVSFSHFS